MMRKIGFVLTALLMTACSIGDDESIGADMMYSPDMNQTAIVFEGVWAVDDTPVSETAVVSFVPSGDGMRMTFTSFPCEGVVSSLLSDLQHLKRSGATQPQMLSMSSVGYSASADYFSGSTSASSTYGQLTFQMEDADGSTVDVTLELLPTASTAVVSQTYANCILMVKCITTTDNSGKSTIWVLNPERKMTFTSTKRL